MVQRHISKIGFLAFISCILIIYFSSKHGENTLQIFLRNSADPVKGTSKIFTPLNCSDEILESVSKTLFFLGHGRSGSSIVGSLLDAHPHVIISNEYNVFPRIKNTTTKIALFKGLFQNSYDHVLSGRRAFAKERGTYNQNVPGQWQGRIKDNVQVMGDKRCKTTVEYFSRTENMNKIYILRRLNIDVKFLHIVRNPFDTVGNLYMRAIAKRYQENESPSVLLALLKSTARKYFRDQTSLVRIKKWMADHHVPVLEVFSEDVVNKPRDTLLGMCTFIGVECYEDYVANCTSILYKSPHRTRDEVNWPEEVIEEVTDWMSRIDFFKRYSFENK